MANYYVSANRGNNSNVGSAASPWLTIAKAVGSSPAITLSGTGDVLYIEPGIYREAVTLALTPTSGGPLSIVGDCDGAGFLAGGYLTPATGVVDWRAWTNDTTPINSPTITLNATPYVTLANLKVIGGNSAANSCLYILGASTNVTVKNCIFTGHAGNQPVYLLLPAGGVAANFIMDQCDINGGFATGLKLGIPLNSTEYNVNILIQNSRISSLNQGIYAVATGGSGSAIGTGITIQFNTVTQGTTGILIYTSSVITMTTPNVIYGNTVYGCQVGITANNASMIANDYNAINAGTAYTGTSVVAGSHDKTTVCPALDFGDARLTGLPYRPWGEPSLASAFAGMVSGGSPPTYDLTGRPRPQGYGSTSPTAGALERHDTGVQNVVYQDAGSPGCAALAGPSSQERPLLVDAAAVVIKVKVRWDGNHGDANKPQAMLVANPEIGVAGQTLTATTTGGSGSTPNSYETLTFSGITPTAPGVVMLRMISRAAAGNGFAYFDTITFS